MSVIRVAADDNSSLAGTSYGRGHLVVGDLAVLGLVAGEELIKGPEPAILLHFQAQRLIHPGADALSAADRDGGLTCLD